MHCVCLHAAVKEKVDIEDLVDDFASFYVAGESCLPVLKLIKSFYTYVLINQIVYHMETN